MSEKEKQLVNDLAKLPEPLKDKFLDQIKGAATCLDALGIGQERKEDGRKEE